MGPPSFFARFSCITNTANVIPAMIIKPTMTSMMINSVLSVSLPLGLSVSSVAVAATGSETEMFSDDADYCISSLSLAVT